MKNLLLFLISILFVASCNDHTTESNSDSTIVELDSKEYLETYVKNPVIFQYLKVNRVSQKATGWIVEKNGNLRSVQIPIEQLDLSGGTVQIAYLETLLQYAGPVERVVDWDQLKESYRLNLISGRYNLNDEIEEDIEEIYQSFILKTQYTSWSAHTECPVFHDPFAQTDSYLSPLLEVNNSLRNESRFNSQIVDWLKTLKGTPAPEGF